MSSVTLTIVLHNHQPRGNFDKVFHEACEKCYEPFLGLLEENTWLLCGLHYSGCLLEWMEENRPDFLDRLKRLVGRGQVEILGGGFYEPIFTMLQERDRRGQIESFSRYLNRRFGQEVRGAWLPERVWEQCLAQSFADAGIRYTILDDAHFKCAGLKPGSIQGYYITEDQGRLLRVLASDENLRYWIPFKEPERTVNYLAGFRKNEKEAVICYGDDGEKFGVWPETHTHCYQDAWLNKFLSALKANLDWLRLRKPGDAIAEFPPTGKIYLPDSSYREMMEWSLPVDSQLEYQHLWENLKRIEWGERVRHFMKAGFWRNFKVKYVGANRMYARMLEASELVARLPARSEAGRGAARELYRGQCNCAYWHGVFGGLYLPHLRRAVYSDLIESSVISERALGGLPHVETADFDHDGLPEVKLNSPLLTAYFEPAQGGRCYEQDLKRSRLNLLNIVHRQREAYHSKVIGSSGKSTEGVETIHELVRFKQPGLDKRLSYDLGPRDSLIDHVLPLDGGPAEAEQVRVPELGDFAEASYQVLSAETEAPVLRMRRDGNVSLHPPAAIRVEKRVALAPDAPKMVADYELTALAETGISGVRFAVEFNVAFSAAEGTDRYFYLAPGKPEGGLGQTAALGERTLIGLVDEWLGLDVILQTDRPAEVWVFPIQTVSQSESGFELIYQGTSVWFVWGLSLAHGSVWRCRVEELVRGRNEP